MPYFYYTKLNCLGQFISKLKWILQVLSKFFNHLTLNSTVLYLILINFVRCEPAGYFMIHISYCCITCFWVFAFPTSHFVPMNCIVEKIQHASSRLGIIYIG